MVRAIVLDFDGVLVESAQIKTAAVARLFAHEPPPLLEQIIAYHRAHGGVSRFEKFRVIYRDILRRPLEGATFQMLCDRFAALVVEALVEAPWVDGAQEFLVRHQGQYRFFVISGTPEPELREIVRRRAMDAFFDEVLGSPMPKDALLQSVLDRHRLHPLETVCVGDSQTDWLAAKRLQVPFIWRAAPGMPALEDFTGAQIPSLVYLEQTLSTLVTVAKWRSDQVAVCQEPGHSATGPPGHSQGIVKHA